MKAFWKGQVQLLLFYLLMLVILLLTEALYQQSAEIVLTTFLVSLPVLFGFLFYRWHQFHKVQHALDAEDFDSPVYPEDASLYVETLQKEQKAIRLEQEKAFAERKELLDYFSLWAHQTKLPLAVLRLFCEQETLDTKDIKMQMKRLDQYIEMAMAYVRLESSSDYKLMTQQVDPIVRAAVRSFSTEFIYKKLILDYQDVHMETITDSKWLQFIIEQILSNSVRYTPKGGTIRIYKEGTTLNIQDSGCGIDPSDLPRIFDQGYSGFNGHTHDSSSGIGLYLCRKVADRLNHAISIHSELNKGTTVSIDLDTASLLFRE